MSEGSFHRVISEHLALAQRNKRLERTMPLGPYRTFYGGDADDPVTHEGQAEPDSVSAEQNPRSWWDTSEERPLPAEFDWGGTD
jgi:hypothetical protein